eukprot:scaffold48_cov311-Pinguiococcus_pyrenoidosus.AAC.54
MNPEHSSSSSSSLKLQPPNGAEAKKRRDALPPDSCDYGSTSFWDRRYLKSETGFEWYHPYPALATLLAHYVKRDDMILIMGCGDSPLPVDMYNDGYKKIVCADVSRVVIDRQKEKHQDLPIQWYAVNMIDCLFEDQQFNVVLDKACLDAIFCHDLGEQAPAKALQEVDRILVPNGLYFLVSRGLPEERLELLEVDRPEEDGYLAWKADVHAIVKPSVDPAQMPDFKDPTNLYYVYACKKDPTMHKEKQRQLARKQAAATGALIKNRSRSRGRGRRGRGRRAG